MLNLKYYNIYYDEKLKLYATRLNEAKPSRLILKENHSMSFS